MTSECMPGMQGFMSSLELLPMWGGVDPDVQLYASGRVLDDQGDWTTGQGLSDAPGQSAPAGLHACKPRITHTAYDLLSQHGRCWKPGSGAELHAWWHWNKCRGSSRPSAALLQSLQVAPLTRDSCIPASLSGEDGIDSSAASISQLNNQEPIMCSSPHENPGCCRPGGCWRCHRGRCWCQQWCTGACGHGAVPERD